jgi:hypothetical protein
VIGCDFRFGYMIPIYFSLSFLLPVIHSCLVFGVIGYSCNHAQDAQNLRI